ncbi:OprD family porin [Lampropedia puyangensis]|uniref:OprD family porin n=1 Tax=Lampropedia puyangensis TaxID=1330072 RepID=A0A4S8EWR4_9BURK|nr:OprD family outer membrane porin [Lampropedia puyangensis]THT98996.1 OprD family porin [Lampropedia puyangensis]
MNHRPFAPAAPMRHLCIAAATLATLATAHAGTQDDAQGFIAGSSLNMLNRYVYEQLDYQHGSTFRATNGERSKTQATESAYGLMLQYQSGYTRGPIGLGLDAQAYGAINLGTDANSARATPRYVAKDGQGIPNRFGRAGAALKIRLSSTELKLGEIRTKNPIFSSSDSRLLPESNRGWLISSSDIPTLALQAGRFTGWADRNARKSNNPLQANYSGAQGDAFRFMGGAWSPAGQTFSLSSYFGQYEDNWNTWYLGGFYKRPLENNRALSVNLNLYRNTDTGQAQSGEVNNTTWSLLGTYATGPHKIGVGYQKVHGNSPFDYVNRGSIWLDNAMQLSDFNGPQEASWQIKYELDLATLLSPGWSAGIAYTRGSGIDNNHLNSVYANYLGYSGHNGKHWERDAVLRYAVPSGRAKGLNLQLRYSMHRTNAAQGEANIDQIKLQAEFPFKLF